MFECLFLCLGGALVSELPKLLPLAESGDSELEGEHATVQGELREVVEGSVLKG